MCLRDQIFSVLLQDFISEVVRKWQRDQMFLLVHFLINFVSKWQRNNCLKTFSVSYHRFCAKFASEAIAIFLLVYFIIDFVRKAVMISQVTASGSGTS